MNWTYENQLIFESDEKDSILFLGKFEIELEDLEEDEFCDSFYEEF